MSPDHNAIIGEAAGVERFLYATGFSGHGFLQGPATGEMLRDLVLKRPTFVDIAPLSVDRFDGARPAPRAQHRLIAARRRTSTSPSTPCARRSSRPLEPGERMKEIPLAAELGISRGPIREALRLLERDGLVELIPNRGALVPEVRAVDVLEVYALRAALGSLALRKLLLEGTVPVDALERALGAACARRPTRGDAQKAADADLAYQSLIIASSGLPRVADEFERLTWQVRGFIVALEHARGQAPAHPGRDEALHARDRRRPSGGAVARQVRALGPPLVERAARSPSTSGLWTALASARRSR